MSQVSYGTITITDTTDIESIYMIYKGGETNTDSPSINWTDGEVDWSTDITQAEGNYIWAITVYKKSGITITQQNYQEYFSEPVCLTGSIGRSVRSISTYYCNYGNGQPEENYTGWSNTVPVYDEEKPNYWIKTVIIYVDSTEEIITGEGTVVTLDLGDKAGIAKSLKVALEPIQSGSGTPSPDNVRPISGHTECVTEVCGVNVWDEEWELGGIGSSNGVPYKTPNAIRAKNFSACLPNTTYYFRGAFAVYWYDNSQAFIKVDYAGNNTKVSPENARCFKIGCYDSYGTTYNHDISINYPSTDHDYHAYDGSTYTTTLGRTVYGGTLDVVSGELVVDRAYAQLDTETTFRASGQARLNGYWVVSVTNIPNISGNIKSKSSVVSSTAPKDMIYNQATVSGFCKNIGSPYPIFALMDSDSGLDGSATLAQLQEAMNVLIHANSPQLVYELANPQTIQLTPQEVQLLLGTNNVWSDGEIEISSFTIAGQDVTIYKDNGLTEAVSKSFEASSKAQEALDKADIAQGKVTQIDTLLGGHFLWHGTALSSLTKAGARVVEQVKNGTTDVSNTPSQWHHNVNIGADGIQLRYNEAVMAQLAATNSNSNDDIALKFYQPPTIGNTTTQGNLTMALRGNALTFYDPTVANGQSVQAILDANGLVLKKGGIESGTLTSGNGYVYLSTEDKTGITINGHNPGNDDPKWRQIIGSKFGVDSEGNLYAAGANIEGAITATQLTISGGGAIYDGASAINANGYTIEIIDDKTAAPTGSIITENQTYLYPVMYLNGEAVTTGITKTNYIWYTNENTATTGGVAGDSTNGGIIATYGNTYRVTYNLSDDAVGTTPSQQTIYTSDARHITDISSSGITIHPEDGSAGNYMQLDSDGLKIYKSSTLLANYGTTVTIGNSSAKNVYIDSNGVQIRDGSISLASFGTTVTIGKSDAKNVYIDSSGIQIKNGSTTLANFGTTITIGESSGKNVYIDTNGVQIRNGSIPLASFGTTAQIGQNESSRFLMNSDSLQAYNSSNVKYFEVNANGLSWGSNTAATTTQVNAAAQTASNYITTVGNDGIKLHPYSEENNYTLINSNGMQVYQEIDNVATKIAEFGSSGTLIGKTSGAHTTIDNDGMQIYTLGVSGNLVQLANLGYGEGTDETGGISNAPYYSFGTRNIGSVIGNYSTSCGTSNEASGYASFAEGSQSVATGTQAHVGGQSSTASGDYSFAYGDAVIASGLCQTVIGRLNNPQGSPTERTSTDLLLIIGNGYWEYEEDESSSYYVSHESNALTVDWSGNVDIASGAEYRINGKSITSQPIKVVQYGWVASPALSERTRVIPGANPANSSNPSDEPSSSEYTFVAWITFTTNGWCGAVYPATPMSRTSDLWTATVKAATTGVSIYGTALYVRNDLL